MSVERPDAVGIALGTAAVVVVVVVSGLPGAALLWVGADDAGLQARQVTADETTTGRVVSLTTSFETTGRNATANQFWYGSARYTLVVEYEYAVAGTTYRSRVRYPTGARNTLASAVSLFGYDRNTFATNDVDEARRLADRYANGSEVTVHYLPGDPETAYLIESVDPTPYLVVYLGLIALAALPVPALWTWVGLLATRSRPVTEGAAAVAGVVVFLLPAVHYHQVSGNLVGAVVVLSLPAVGGVALFARATRRTTEFLAEAFPGPDSPDPGDDADDSDAAGDPDETTPESADNTPDDDPDPASSNAGDPDASVGAADREASTDRDGGDGGDVDGTDDTASDP